MTACPKEQARTSTQSRLRPHLGRSPGDDCRGLLNPHNIGMTDPGAAAESPAAQDPDANRFTAPRHKLPPGRERT